MEYDKIKQLMEDMGNSKLSSIDIDFPELLAPNVVITSNDDKEENVQTKQTKEDESENLKLVTSPMVGTFYIKPSPTSKPYVEKGDYVKKGDTLCIVEAMKLMNEIESEFDGEIYEIYVKDGEPVEYGLILFYLN